MIPGKPSLFVLPFPASLTCGKEIFTLLNTVQYKSAMIQAKGQSVGSTLAAINGLAYTKRTSAQSIYSSVRIHVSTKVSHLQALTILLPDALPTLGSHSVYSCGICTGYSL